jgi:O-methyltransferase involved in polyketide biosynthesis
MNAPPAPARIPLALGPVARTLLVPLWARAEETRRADGVLRDPSAVAIVGALDFDFAVLRDAQASQLGCCVRAALIDGWARDFLARHPDGTVIELGAGLNSRPARIDNGRARHVALDLPEVVALRRRFFTDDDRRTTLAASLTEQSAFDALRPYAAGPCLVLSEGVLVYLDEPEVRRVFARLRAALPGATFVFDAMTEPVVRLQGAHDAMRHFDARFVWALADPKAIASFAPGVTLEGSQSFYDLLYAHPHRLPRWMRAAGPVVARAWPAVRDCYTIQRVRL